MGIKKPYQTMIDEINNIGNNIKHFILLETPDIIYWNTKLHLKCTICDYDDWYTTHNKITKSTNGCPNCAGCVTPTQEEAVANVIQIGINTKHFKLLEIPIHKDHDTRYILQCTECGHIWDPIYDRIVKSSKGCPKCAGVYKKTQEEAELILNKQLKLKNLALISSFIFVGVKTKLLMKCLVCGYDKIKTTYQSFIYLETGCGKCYGNVKYEQDEAVENVIKMGIIKNFKIKSIPIYKNSTTKFELKCTICGHEWEYRYDTIMNDTCTCSECAKLKRIQTCIERYGETWLKHTPKHNSNSIIYLDMISEMLNNNIQHALNGGEKKFHKYWVDGYIEEYNICIEWNERIHYQPKHRKKDYTRSNYIKENFDCIFYEINEKEFLKDPEHNIIKIVNEIKIIIRNINT